MHLIRCATLTSSDLDRSVDWYTTWLDYEVVEDSLVDADLAASWNAPLLAGRPQIVMRPASGRDVYLRFIKQDAHADYVPLKSYGWNAVEICTQDTEVVNARMVESPFKIIGPPQKIAGLDSIYPMQVMGPDQEVVYLTQINGDLPEYDLPRASSLIDSLFILVMGSSDMDRELGFLKDVVGLSPGRSMDIDYTMINKAHGLPAGSLHTISTVKHDRDVFLEVDQYPDSSAPRPKHDGELCPGIAIGTLYHPDFDAVLARSGKAAITPPGLIYNGKRAMTLTTPDGTLIEIVDA